MSTVQEKLDAYLYRIKYENRHPITSAFERDDNPTLYRIMRGRADAHLVVAEVFERVLGVARKVDQLDEAMVVYLRECLAGMLVGTLKEQPISSPEIDVWYLHGAAGAYAEAERYVQHCLDEARIANKQPSTWLHDYIVFVKHTGGKHTFLYTIRVKSESEAKGLVCLAFDGEHPVDEWNDWSVTAIEISLTLKVQSVGRLEGRI